MVESFHLQEVLSEWGENNDADYGDVVAILRTELGIDSWQSFLELEPVDIKEVAGLEACSPQLLEIRKFINGTSVL